MASQQGVVSKRTFQAMLLLILFLVIFSVVASFFGENIQGDRISDHTKSDSFSRGAIGHHGLTALLTKLNIKVLRIRNTYALVKSKAPLMFADSNQRFRLPSSFETLGNIVKTRYFRGLPSILVLPKWSIHSSSQPGKFVAEAKIKSNYAAKNFFDSVFPDISITVTRGRGFLANYQFRNQQGKKITVRATSLQTVKQKKKSYLGGFSGVTKARIEPLLIKEKETLVFELIHPFKDEDKPTKKKQYNVHKTPGLRNQQSKNGRIFIITDPDLVSNWNFFRQDNSLVLLSLLKDTLKTDKLLIDEIFHGNFRYYSLFRELKRFPFFFLTIHVFVFISILLWSGFRRFGVIEYLTFNKERGPQEIIDITSHVLTHGQMPSHIAGNYIKHLVEQIGEELECKTKSGIDLDKLERIALSRGIEFPANQWYSDGQMLSKDVKKLSEREALRKALEVWQAHSELAKKIYKKS